MIVCCPSCMESISLDYQLLQEIIQITLNCPQCGADFKPLENNKTADAILEELKDELTIQRSIQLQSRMFDDC